MKVSFNKKFLVLLALRNLTRVLVYTVPGCLHVRVSVCQYVCVCWFLTFYGSVLFVSIIHQASSPVCEVHIISLVGCCIDGTTDDVYCPKFTSVIRLLLICTFRRL